MFGPLSFLALSALLALCCFLFVWLTQRAKDRMRSVAGRVSESAGDQNIVADTGGVSLSGRLDGTVEIDGKKSPLVFGPRRKPRRADRALMLTIAAAARLFEARFGEAPVVVAGKFGDGTEMIQPVVPSLMEDFESAMELLARDKAAAAMGIAAPRSHCRADLCEKCPYFHVCDGRLSSSGSAVF